MKNKAAQADSPVWFDGKNISEALVSPNINGILADSLRTYVQAEYVRTQRLPVFSH